MLCFPAIILNCGLCQRQLPLDVPGRVAHGDFGDEFKYCQRLIFCIMHGVYSTMFKGLLYISSGRMTPESGQKWRVVNATPDNV